MRGRAPGPYRAGTDLGAAPSLPAVAVEEEADEAPQAQAPEDEAALQVILLQLAQGGGARSSLVPGGAGAGLEPVLPPPPRACEAARGPPLLTAFRSGGGASVLRGDTCTEYKTLAACRSSSFFHRKLVSWR